MKFQQFFGSDESRRRYWSRSLAGFSEIADREPNAAHHGLAAFEAAGVSVPLITQNVDGLHQRAGSEGVLELHGSIFGVRCLSCQGQTSRREFQQRLADMNPNFVARVRAVAPDGDAELDGASLDDFLVPECEKCRGILKPDVVFFGESVPADWVARAYARLEAARGVLVVGSSLMVFSGYRFAKRGLSDAARLLKLRGQAMQKAVPVGEGAMAALLGLELEAAREVAEEASAEGVCDCANDNAPGQVVVSGAKAAVEKAVAIAGERGAKRSIMLPVSAPFHCALMQPAAEVMEEALAATAIETPLVPLVANVTAQRVDGPERIRKLLVEQVTAMVRWRESVLYMRDGGVDTLVEAGAGKILSGLTRRIDRDLAARSLQSPADFEAFVKDL
jgi:[acyl-carrier-protein] S-malonyltransferase